VRGELPYRELQLRPCIGEPAWRAWPWLHVCAAAGLLPLQSPWAPFPWGFIGRPLVNLSVFVMLLWALPWFGYLVARRRRAAARVHGRRTLVWGAALLMCLGVRAEEHRRITRVIAAVNAYRTFHGRDPARLADLVPAHIARLPRARLFTDRCRYDLFRDSAGMILQRRARPAWRSEACDQVRFYFNQRQWDY